MGCNLFTKKHELYLTTWQFNIYITHKFKNASLTIGLDKLNILKIFEQARVRRN